MIPLKLVISMNIEDNSMYYLNYCIWSLLFWEGWLDSELLASFYLDPSLLGLQAWVALPSWFALVLRIWIRFLCLHIKWFCSLNYLPILRNPMTTCDVLWYHSYSVINSKPHFILCCSATIFLILKNECGKMNVCVLYLDKNPYRRDLVVSNGQNLFWRCRWRTSIPPCRLISLCLLNPLTAFETASGLITH